eukprot:750679-Hanusia_phi.AAC.1
MRGKGSVLEGLHQHALTGEDDLGEAADAALTVEVVVEDVEMVGLHVEASLRGDGMGELLHGRLQVQPVQPGDPVDERPERAHDAEVEGDLLLYVGMANLYCQLLPVVSGKMNLSNAPGRERLSVEPLEVGEDVAELEGKDVWPYRRPLPPLNEGCSRVPERHGQQLVPHVVPKAGDEQGQRAGDEGEEVDEGEVDGPQEELCPALLDHDDAILPPVRGYHNPRPLPLGWIKLEDWHDRSRAVVRLIPDGLRRRSLQGQSNAAHKASSLQEDQKPEEKTAALEEHAESQHVGQV